MDKWRCSWQKFVVLAIATWSIIFVLGIIALAPPQSAFALPRSRVHELPPSLAKWSDVRDRSDYFKKIEVTPLGYLIWAEFPVKVYIQQPSKFSDSAADQRYQEWVNAVRKAIAEWKVYLPLKEIIKEEQADITVLRSQPKREAKLNPETGLYDIPRAVTAETSYKFYIKQNPATIAHKMKVEISPNYGGISLLATVRHELGHALGIWGHSQNKADALYFSQVCIPPGFSSRDVNTLNKIYLQPSNLGWEI
ncbi:MAG: matrixin family metalloprotease [Pleurocapsa sp.]